MAGKRQTPLEFLWESFHALIPALAIDVGGTLILYWLLVRILGTISIWPVLGASLVPAVTNVVSLIRRGSVDIVGLVVLIGMIAGLIPAAFGGGQRDLLLRDSLVNGLIGVVLIVSVFVHRPILYYVIREFLTANDTLPIEHFNVLWRERSFRRELELVTLAWGLLLVGELALRVFMAYNWSVGTVLSLSPFVSTTILLLAGVGTAIWLGRATAHALH